MTEIHADAGEISRFVDSLFRYAVAGTFISLRAFHQFENTVLFTKALKINGDLAAAANIAREAAEVATVSPIAAVFCPPICTFSNPVHARIADLANGLTLSVELDDVDPDSALARLTGLLGPPTLIVRSGSDWIDPVTGEAKPKTHFHWRLSEPTLATEEHDQLRQARSLATQLAGGDPTAKPIVHPLRWPGSWNFKTTPRMAFIAVENADAEIHLTEALAALEAAIEAAGWAKAEMPQSSGEAEAPLADIRSALAAIPNPGRDVHISDWVRLGYAIHRATGGSLQGYILWDNWSLLSEKYNADTTEATWRRIAAAKPSRIGAGTIFYLAARNGWTRSHPFSSAPGGRAHAGSNGSADDTSRSNGAGRPEPEPDPNADAFQRDGALIDPRLWTFPAPPRVWVIPEWIPRGTVTGLYGDGGVGKSLLLQQLLTSVACGRPWLGMPTTAGPAFGLMCEDDPEEMHRRQDAINCDLGVAPQDLGMLRYSSRVGDDNLLMTFDERNRGELTPLFGSLMARLKTMRPMLVGIDTVADTFGGDEIKRIQVRQFVQGVGGNIARAFGCAVVFCAHPSVAGIVSGSGTSGSTAWHNTFRSRMFMTAPKPPGKADKGDIAEPIVIDPNVRLLSRLKANYAPKNAEVVLRWSNGAFTVDSSQTAAPGLDWPTIDKIFTEIDRAWKAKPPWSCEPQTKKHGRYLPLWMQVTCGCPEKTAARYVQSWLAGGYLESSTINSDSKARGLRILKWLQP